MERGFRSKCGSPITLKPLSRPNVLFAYAASLDDPTRYFAMSHRWDLAERMNRDNVGAVERDRPAGFHRTNRD